MKRGEAGRSEERGRLSFTRLLEFRKRARDGARALSGAPSGNDDEEAAPGSQPGERDTACKLHSTIRSRHRTSPTTVKSEARRRLTREEQRRQSRAGGMREGKRRRVARILEDEWTVSRQQESLVKAAKPEKAVRRRARRCEMESLCARQGEDKAEGAKTCGDLCGPASASGRRAVAKVAR